MEENQITEVVVAALKERSKDIYDDGLKPATKESGEALQAIVGLFNNVILYPVKKANITYKYKLEQFEEDLKNKIEEVPDGKLIEPPLNISGPTLEALKYTFDVEELREMYINLLSSSMNSDTVMLSHPSYVEIIKSMTSLDAIIFKNIIELKKSIPCAHVTIGHNNKAYMNMTPVVFAPDLLNDNDPFLVSSSIGNLCRLGILTHLDVGVTGYDYDGIVKHPFISQQLEECKKIDSKANFEIRRTKEAIFLNDFGKNFARACL